MWEFLREYDSDGKMTTSAAFLSAVEPSVKVSKDVYSAKVSEDNRGAYVQ